MMVRVDQCRQDDGPIPVGELLVAPEGEGLARAARRGKGTGAGDFDAGYGRQRSHDVGRVAAAIEGHLATSLGAKILQRRPAASQQESLVRQQPLQETTECEDLADLSRPGRPSSDPRIHLSDFVAELNVTPEKVAQQRQETYFGQDSSGSCRRARKQFGQRAGTLRTAVLAAERGVSLAGLLIT